MNNSIGMAKKNLILTIILSAVISFTANGQSEDCVIQLQEAERLYSQGQVENIPQMLEDCIAEGFNKEERLQAYKLIILTFLTDDNMRKADSAMIDFLKRYPEYEITVADPAEFVYLFGSYKTLPLYSLGVTLGTSFSSVNSLESFGTYNLNMRAEPAFSISGIPLRVGITFSRYITKGLDVNLEVFYTAFNFSYQNKAFGGLELNEGAYGKVNYDETQSHLEVPVSFTYDLGQRRVRPYFRLGFAVSYMLTATSSTTLDYTYGTHDTRKGQSIDRLDNRNPFNYWALGGVGVKFKITKGYFFADFRANIGINEQLKDGTRYIGDGTTYELNDLTWYYGYTDDNFLLNNLIVSVGYVRLFYKPKKLEGFGY
jgi:hypothetical protein